MWRRSCRLGRHALERLVKTRHATERRLEGVAVLRVAPSRMAFSKATALTPPRPPLLRFGGRPSPSRGGRVTAAGLLIHMRRSGVVEGEAHASASGSLPCRLLLRVLGRR